MIKSNDKSFILWPVCILTLCKCVFFPNFSVTCPTFLLNFLKVGWLYFRVLYIKQNLPHHLFSMWNMSLICSPMPEKRGVSKYPRTFGHPVFSLGWQTEKSKSRVSVLKNSYKLITYSSYFLLKRSTHLARESIEAHIEIGLCCSTVQIYPVLVDSCSALRRDQQF